MTDHVHEWRWNELGIYACRDCPDATPPANMKCLGVQEAEAMLNAAEKTKTWLHLNNMFRLDPDISLDEVDNAEEAMREAYAKLRGEQ